MTDQNAAVNSTLVDLLPLLQRLDSRLEYATAIAQEALDLESATDSSTRWSSTATNSPQSRPDKFTVSYCAVSAEFPSNWIKPESALAQLQQMFGLSTFDLDIVAIALAPELDRRYERLYAYLQDDVRCKRPSIDLALNLLCANAVEKLNQRSHFAPDAPLLRHALLHLVGDAASGSTFLAQELHLDQQVVRFLLAQPGLDPLLAPFCQLSCQLSEYQPSQIADRELLLPPDLQSQLFAQVSRAWQTRQPLRLYFQGHDRLSQHHIASLLASKLAAPLLRVELPRLIATKVEIEPMLKRLFREAAFQNALLYLEGVESLHEQGGAIGDRTLRMLLSTTDTVTLLSGTATWSPEATDPPLGMLTLPLPLPNFTQRRNHWQTQLGDEAIADSELDALADRFCLTSAQISEAIATARNAAQRAGTPLNLTDLFTAARAQSGHELEGLARKIEPKYTWSDIVLQPDPLAQLQELCNQSRYRHVVYGEWEFDRKLSLGKGLNALFSGLPGTGKTMATEIIAAELQLDIYKIDLSQIVSKYIGETEKNLNRIFTAAANSNAILLFDEADALFGKRSEVQDAHDRYANIEIGYLLQKIEEYEGIAILTTNFRSSVDNAFVRRLRFIIEFPTPNQRDRRRIWQQIWSDRAPLSPDLDLDFFAQRLEITGAEIRNIALAAAFLAASEDKPIAMRHIAQAARREYQKMGKLLTDDLSYF